MQEGMQLISHCVVSVLGWCNYLLVQEEERDTQKGLCESFHARIAVVGTGQDVSHIITFSRQLLLELILVIRFFASSSLHRTNWRQESSL